MVVAVDRAQIRCRVRVSQDGNRDDHPRPVVHLLFSHFPTQMVSSAVCRWTRYDGRAPSIAHTVLGLINGWRQQVVLAAPHCQVR